MDDRLFARKRFLGVTVDAGQTVDRTWTWSDKPSAVIVGVTLFHSTEVRSCGVCRTRFPKDTLMLQPYGDEQADRGAAYCPKCWLTENASQLLDMLNRAGVKTFTGLKALAVRRSLEAEESG